MWFNVHTHQANKQANVVEIVNKYPDEIIDTENPFSIGIHPYYADLKSLNNALDVMQKYIQYTNCLAVGECGLDKKHNWNSYVQKSVFIEQIKLAEKFNKPIIIHCVAAYQELTQLKKDLKIQTPVIIHGFAKSSLQLAQELIKKDFYLSFGKHLLVNEKLAYIFKNIPSHRCFLETDSAPNVNIQDIYNKAQALKGLQTKKVIEYNFNEVFNR